MLILLRNSAAVAYVDVAALLRDLMPSLNARYISDLEDWTEEELYAYATQAATDYARSVGFLVERDTAGVLATGTATYALPTGHISSLYVSAGGLFLSPANIQEIEARDEDWSDTDDTPSHFLMDTDPGYVRLYPTPTAEDTGAVEQIFHKVPADITAAAPTVTGPQMLRDYIGMRILAAIRARESQSAMPEVARWAKEACGVWEQAGLSYWGGAA